ncbi:hypothetical protein BDD14_4278 [Edaphobacter modestus]|uniref:Uncharacterized protein n=1 Tax=Edaphobacter modestus TaxID=388466 RepID=A0A4V2G4X5_9BACT|nr:hypothetical protein BDD14_4278 [Edaphobacter modestus]
MPISSVRFSIIETGSNERLQSDRACRWRHTHKPFRFNILVDKASGINILQTRPQDKPNIINILEEMGGEGVQLNRTATLPATAASVIARGSF